MMMAMYICLYTSVVQSDGHKKEVVVKRYGVCLFKR